MLSEKSQEIFDAKLENPYVKSSYYALTKYPCSTDLYLFCRGHIVVPLFSQLDNVILTRYQKKIRKDGL